MLRARSRLRASTGLAVWSLNLEFATAAGGLDPRVTFSRTSQATLVDATGRVTYAPNNLLTNSQQFDNVASWTLEGSTLSGGRTAPDGTATAYLFTATAPSGNRRITQVVTQVTGVNYIRSIWIRRVTGTGTILLRNPAGGDTDITSQISSTWSRVVVTGTATGASNFILAFTVTGDALEIWGAQLEAVTYQTTPGTYNSTTPKNLLGFTQEFDNAAWTKSNSFVQTNLLTNSDGTVAQLGASSNVTNAAAPISSSFTNSIQFGDNSLLRFAYKAATSTASIVYTFSIFVRMNNGAAPVVGATNTTGDFGLVTEGNLVTTAPTVTNLGGGVYRITHTFTAAGGSNLNYGIIKYTGQSANQFAITGYQLVQGATAGDYQPTYAAAAAVQYAAPDGTLSADKLVADTVNTSHRLTQLAAASNGAIHVVSMYVKAAEYSRFGIREGNFTGAYASFDLAAGTVLDQGAGGTGAITAVGNGWYRVSMLSTAGGITMRCDFFPLPNSYTTGAPNLSYTGDGTSGIFIWGAQLSNSASLDPYVYNPAAAPTSAAFFGPRFDYNPVTLAPRGLLIEEQRTNLLTYSEQFDNAAWVKTSATITANATTAPDGTNTADRVQATAPAVVTQDAVVNATSATYTIYAKQGSGATEGSRFLLRNVTTATNLIGILLDYSTGGITYTVGSSGASATNVGNGWWRISLSAATGITSGNQLSCYVGFTGGGSAGQFMFAWGAQLEAGAFATSYIPTVASQVTRTADVATMVGTNFASWFNANEGSFVFSGDSAYGNGGFVGITPTTGAILYGNNAAVRTFNGTNFIGTANTFTASIPFSTAMGYSSAGRAIVLNGAAVVTDANLIQQPTAITLGGAFGGGYINGHIRSIRYYPTRLSNTQLQALTA